MTPSAVVAAVLVIVFVGAGLAFAAVLDRRRSREIVHDPQRPVPRADEPDTGHS